MSEFLAEINWSPLWISLKTGFTATVIAFFLGIFFARLVMKMKPFSRGILDGILTAFCTQLNPTLEEVADLKTAVSEAVTNCIIHAYEGQVQKIEIFCRREGQKLWVDVIDKGVGIRDVAKAMEPLFTTKPEKDRSGMGFTFMEAFMDEVTVESQVGYGTVVHMKKTIGR